MMLFLVPLAIRNGYVAYLLWGWAGLAAIDSYLFGFMRSIQLALTFALIALIAFPFRHDPDRRKFELNRTTVLFLVFAAHCVLSASFAYGGQVRNWEIATNMLKTILFCLLMPMLVTTRFRIHALVVMIAVATAHHGIVDGLKFLSSGGGHLARGIHKFGDNNHYAMVIIMGIPYLVYLHRYTEGKLARMGFLAAIPLVVLAVVATRSRGGLACLMAAAMWYVLTSRQKIRGSIGVALMGLLIVFFAPAEWTERMNTISSAEDDSSFLGRVGAWRISSAIAMANPVFGGGFHAVEVSSTWNLLKDAHSLFGFVPNIDLNGLNGGGRAAHSIYFEVMGDLGFVGLFFFLTILANAIATARKTVHMARAAGQKLEWAAELATVQIIVVIAFMSGGALLSVAYFELPYIVFMLIEVLHLHVRRLTRN